MSNKIGFVRKMIFSLALTAGFGVWGASAAQAQYGSSVYYSNPRTGFSYSQGAYYGRGYYSSGFSYSNGNRYYSNSNSYGTPYGYHRPYGGYGYSRPGSGYGCR